MSETFYHVDRDACFEPGETLRLEPVAEVSPQAEAALDATYPGGLSRHGRHYCTQDLYVEESDDLWDFACEAIFEVVRATRFPDRPSRLQSVFAFRTRREVEAFLDRFVDSSYAVWRVEAERSFVADMNLVDATDYADGIRRASTYWRGETFLDDPLWEVLLVPPVTVVEAVEI